MAGAKLSDSLQSARPMEIVPGQVLVMKQPSFPQFRFEWHPFVKRVYVIRIGAAQEIGDPIAFEITENKAAMEVTRMWLRGYTAAKHELSEVMHTEPPKDLALL